MNALRALLASFSYFSIFPGRTFDERVNDGAIAWLPLVGLVTGGVSGAGAYGVYLLTHAPIAAAIVAWLLSIALSGAIHIDGFLDCCDGLLAMVEPKRRIEIMRDPHHGTYAITGMAMLSAVWLYALAQIAPGALPWTLAMAGVGSRTCGAVVALSGRAWWLAPFAALALLGLGGVHAWLSPLVVALVMAIGTLAVALFARRRLGGRLTGDCYGAVVVVTEAALLLAVPYLMLLR